MKSVEISDAAAELAKELVSRGEFSSDAEAIEESLRRATAETSIEHKIELGLAELDAGKSISSAEVFARIDRLIAERVPTDG
ncbi:hypothetical protein [Stratiformator vulcanicus]|uniref:Antitoxin ParD1 n=1 Tax=Stratiformator vulcanicus TaxID=2527980 RepID=A0A517QW29_9PLAN|nr:hypothetical protein [Stratiformator vulcanicus]QDT35814.1 hypothetical protein Pan189_01670 [Stratiformator vulcanicus]